MGSRTSYPEDLSVRLKKYALRVLKLASSLPQTPEGLLFRRQIARSGTSPGAHFREARRARSSAEFISKMNGGLQELDETDWWLELLGASGLVSARRLVELRDETNQLIAIFVTCIKNSRRRG
ncbi:MAG TPA: four helix bundle protein [Tepidisphaeraceae bacterium]